MRVEITDIQGVTTMYQPIAKIDYDYWKADNYNERVVWLEGDDFKVLIPWSAVVHITVIN